MLTSRGVMARTGISRATLNNYIALGILPRPIVGVAGPGAGSVRRIGYFEDQVVERVEEVQRLKRQGLAMTDIAARFTGDEVADEGRRTANGEEEGMSYRASDDRRGAAGPSIIEPGRPLRLTIEDIPHPAYMVNNNFELEWWNTEAANEIFHRRHGFEGESGARNVFRLLLEAQENSEGAEWMDALRLHIGVAKNWIPSAGLARLTPEIGADNVALLQALHDETPVIAKRRREEIYTLIQPKIYRTTMGSLSVYTMTVVFLQTTHS